MTAKTSLHALIALALVPACADDSPDADGSGTATSGAPSTGQADAASDESDAGTVDGTGAATMGSDSDGEASTGGDSDDSTGDTGSADTSDDGSGSSSGGEMVGPVTAIPPTWLRELDGLLSLAPPRVAALPNGDAAALLTGGLYADQIAFAVGDDDELVLDTPYVVPALATFEGTTGGLGSARLLAEVGAGAPYGISVQVESLDRAPNGDLLAAGTFVGTATFFPGTADATSMVALQTLNGAALDRAEDPFFFRLTPEGDLVWMTRGRTPAPLSTTWFNYGEGIASLPDGEAVVSGELEQSGFIFGDGTPGQTVLAGSQDSYVSRLDASGSPTWVGRNTARIAWDALRTSPDGAIYGFLPGSATLFADSASPVVVSPEPEMQSLTLARIDPAGALAWTATIAWESGGPLGLEVTVGGSLVVYGNNSGELLFRDPDGVETTETFDDYRGWVAGIDAEGHVEWLHTHGEGHTNSWPALGGTDGVWIATHVVAPFDVEVAGEMVPLPELGLDDEAIADVLVRIDADGDVAAAQVLGSDTRLSSLDWIDDSQTGVFAIGGYYCEFSLPFVVDADGTGLEALTTGCDMEPHDDQRGWIASLPLGE